MSALNITIFHQTDTQLYDGKYTDLMMFSHVLHLFRIEYKIFPSAEFILSIQNYL